MQTLIYTRKVNMILKCDDKLQYNIDYSPKQAGVAKIMVYHYNDRILVMCQPSFLMSLSKVKSLPVSINAESLTGAVYPCRFPCRVSKPTLSSFQTVNSAQHLGPYPLPPGSVGQQE